MQQKTLGIVFMSAGFLLAGGYWVLRLLHVGKFGAASDIGGGVVALVGYGCLLAGAVVLGSAVVGRRRR